MAAREERLTSATRNYVIFGLAFVIAGGLALRNWLDPHQARGEADSALRVLVVSDSEVLPIAGLVEVDGFNVTQISPSEAIVEGKGLVDEDESQRGAALAYADQHGYGFVILDLDADLGHDWGLAEGSGRFAVFSVGDLAAEGPREYRAELAVAVELDPRLAELDSLRLGLYDHPDLLRLFAIEGNASELQAKQVLANRGIDDRRSLIHLDHARWRAAAEVWPAPEAVPGTLAAAWERVQAAPIVGGLLVEVRGVHPRVSLFRALTLELDPTASLYFVASAVQADPNAREPCSGLPTHVTGEVAVAPDGGAVVIRQAEGEPQLYVFEHRPGQACRAREIEIEIASSVVGRASASGAMTWNDDDWLRWWDDHGAHELRVAGIGLSSGPWWADASVLAMVGEQTIRTAPETDPNAAADADPDEADDFDDFDDFELAFEPVVVLLSTAPTSTDPDDPHPRVAIGTAELFGEFSPDTPIVDLRPAGPDALLVTTERCFGQPFEQSQPCLHRLTARPAPGPNTPADPITPAPSPPLRELVDAVGEGSRPLAEALQVETLGSMPPHVELAVAADGSRVAWIDRRTRQLWVADLHGPQRMVPRRLDIDALSEASLRISADGRVVLSEITVPLATDELELGSVTIPRAFVLEPVPASPKE